MLKICFMGAGSTVFAKNVLGDCMLTPSLIQYRNPKNYYLVHEALIKAHREDLIGSGPKCLIRAVPPRPGRVTAPPPKLPQKGRNVHTTPGFKPKPPKAEVKGRPAGRTVERKKR